jgi:hypothetical protein
MPNNINLGAGRAVNAAISHVENNSFRFTNVGMMAALRDPSLRKLIDETNPFLVAQTDGGKNLLAYKDGTYNPRILLNYKPAATKGYRTSRAASGGSTGSNGVGVISGEVQAEILFTKYHEFEVEETLFTSDIFKEAATVEYLNKLANPSVRAAAMADSQYNSAKKALGVVGYEILSRLDADLVTPVGADLITSVAAAVGKNAAFPVWDTIGGTADAPVIQVNAFESDGETPTINFWDTILDTQRMNRFSGKPLLVGGQKMARYMQKKGVVSLADTGFNLDAMLNLPVIWYYDALIDSVYGEDQVLMFDNGAACLQTWNDYSPYGLVKTRQHQNMYYGNLTLDINQFAVSGSQAPETYMLEMDFRVLEGLALDYPTNRLTPSMRYGIYKRPVGFFTSDTGNILNKVTGVFAFKLNNKA